MAIRVRDFLWLGITSPYELILTTHSSNLFSLYEIVESSEFHHSFTDGIFDFSALIALPASLAVTSEIVLADASFFNSSDTICSFSCGFVSVELPKRFKNQDQGAHPFLEDNGVCSTFSSFIGGVAVTPTISSSRPMLSMSFFG